MHTSMLVGSKYYELYFALSKEGSTDDVEYIKIVNKLWASESGSTAGVLNQRVKNML